MFQAKRLGSEEVHDMTQLIHSSEEGHGGRARQRVGHQRYGDCHRCGWAQSLHKVRLRRSTGSHLDRAEIMARGSVWLCDECAADLSTEVIPKQVRSSARVNRPAPPSPDRVVA
jgi:hypothetical protein